MTLPTRTVLIGSAAFAALAIAGAVRGSATTGVVAVPRYQPPAAEPVAALKHRPVGMAGCLAAACHGGPAEKTLARTFDGHTWQSSGSCWVAADPHTAAYSLLTDAPNRPVKVTAKHIMDRYAPGKPATEEARCVACHTNPALAAPEKFNDPHSRELRKEGVSCEACHGNAGGWVSNHTTWKGERGKVYADTGMNPLYDIGARAITCAGCHVGAPADPERGIPVRDMNHDMIAAGHPRLNFDFAEYQRRLPQHWQEKDRTTDSPRTLNAVKVWLVGRYAHAEAACKLLEDRAARAGAGEERSPWPELAEFNCAACHHNLRVAGENEKYPNWRRSAEYLGDRPPGSAPWQMIWPVGYAPGIPKPERGKSELSEVIRMMEKNRPASANTAKVVAGNSAGELHTKRVSLVGRPDAEVEAEARSYFPPGAPLVPEWDTARQLFFGLAALDRTRPKYSDGLLQDYRQGVKSFREQDWSGVEKAFEAIRKAEK